MMTLTFQLPTFVTTQLICTKGGMQLGEMFSVECCPCVPNLSFFLVQTDTNNINKYEFNLLLTFRYLIFTVWVFVLKLCVLYTN